MGRVVLKEKAEEVILNLLMQEEDIDRNNPEPFQVVKNARKTAKGTRSRKQSCSVRTAPKKKERKMTVEILDSRSMDEEAGDSIHPNSFPMMHIELEAA